MGKTRFMTLVFVVWSIAFFFVPEFRQGMQLPLIARRRDWLVRAGPIGPRSLQQFATAGEQQRDAPTLAFVALHMPNQREGTRLAGEAVALDTKLTWIYYTVIMQNRDDAEVDQWIAQLEAWDTGNAVPYLVEGDQIRYRRLGKTPSASEYEALEKEAAWRQAMAKAFAAGHYDPYTSRRFELERDWLRQHNLADPLVVVLSLSSYPVPNLLNIRQYVNMLVEEQGKQAEEAGHLPEAMGDYWTVAHFGERFQLETGTAIEKMIGAALQVDAYGHLIPLLRQIGRGAEALTLEYAQRELRQRQDILEGKDPLTHNSIHYWAALTENLFAGLVVVFGLSTAFLLVYLNIKRAKHTAQKRGLLKVLSEAENYVPILLFLSCAGLYVTYFPYAQNFRYYMTAQGQIHDFEPLFVNVLPLFGITEGRTMLPIENPFWSYAWFALGGLALVVIVSLVFRRRATKGDVQR